MTASQVQHALSAFAATRSTATVFLAHNCLKRAIRQAEARDLVRRNVAELVSTPTGKGKGRPSRSLTLVQATALMAVAEDTTMNAYTVIALTTGIRTEEARELRWDHVDLTGDPDADPPVPPHVAVWRSVRAGGDTKTPKSRRTLRLPEIAVDALFAHRARQSGERIAAGDRWHDTGLVFTSKVGTALDSANVKRDFRAACKTAGIGEDWTPRELRHFVSA